MLLLSSHLYFSALVWVAHGCGSSGGSSPGNSPSGMLLPQDGLPTGHSPSEMPPSSTRSLAVSPTLSPPYVSVISPAPMATTLCQQCVPGPMGVWELAGNGCGWNGPPTVSSCTGTCRHRHLTIFLKVGIYIYESFSFFFMHLIAFSS